MNTSENGTFQTTSGEVQPHIPSAHIVLKQIMDQHGLTVLDIGRVMVEFSAQGSSAVLTGEYPLELSTIIRLGNEWKLTQQEKFELLLAAGHITPPIETKNQDLTLLHYGLQKGHISPEARRRIDMLLHEAAGIVLEDLRSHSSTEENKLKVQ